MLVNTIGTCLVNVNRMICMVVVSRVLRMSHQVGDVAPAPHNGILTQHTNGLPKHGDQYQDKERTLSHGSNSTDRCALHSESTCSPPPATSKQPVTAQRGEQWRRCQRPRHSVHQGCVDHVAEQVPVVLALVGGLNHQHGKQVFSRVDDEGGTRQAAPVVHAHGARHTG